MRIGIEAQRIFRKNKHGMDYVVLQEIRELQRMDTDNEYFVYVKPGEDICLESSANVHVVELRCPSYPLWEQYALPRAARRDRVDMLHCTSNTAPVWCGGIPLVLTLHDIIFLEPRDKHNKSLYQNLGRIYRRMVVPKVIGKCRRIITVSNFELDNIVGRLKLPRDRMAMIYNGYNDWFRPVKDTAGVYRKYIGERGYFFFLGNTDPKKNTARTIMAYAGYLERSDVKRKLLVADLKQESIDAILRDNGIEHIREYVVPSGYIVNSDLPYIYNDAFAFLYTSLRESFGIPLLEAMACGTPVVTSDTSSMPEIAGPDAALTSPERAGDITEMMLRLENDHDFRERQINIGLERVKMFSWRKTAEELLRLYKDVYMETSGHKPH
ncbi:glycosyltransferase family 4 protein [Xylanibacter rodentium]|jgi:glycosyltransferase involved in cell wall biosynthesis|uniref:Glycosyltransferase family 4 protein n=1 Tax=Xylanibacter rodentium TaxID=2736289 RepID=A0ABX2AWH9_9BACT|nr:glycosyltransferase family 1 protein [Xylanibacter rodentium]NPE12333.1 glycosyltransferase family 4 protein [Prevotella sp. PJ1A]NPE14839.1 glycosyltransferase family 4 protein [Xylanibacter rodentium]NPE39853.1 glycosyltransferase family 4 protein [Prevotella sp. PCJ2]